MARFLIRNYGPSRQIAYKGQQICLSRDQCIETDDSRIAAVLGAEKQVHVTDHGVEAAAPVPPEKQEGEDRTVTVDDAEAVHDEKFPDEDVQEQHIQEEQQPVLSNDADEIAYADMNVKELRVLAKDRQIETSDLKKADLIKALEDYDAEGDLPDTDGG